MSKVLSLDQSTRVTGYCLVENGEYVLSGIIDKHKISDTDVRTGEMGIAICEKIKELTPDVVILENVQQQAGVSTVILLARLQGIVLGYNYSNGIETKIVSPTQWRSALGYKQGPKIKRAELKQQSLDYAEKHLGLKDRKEDELEACCINLAAHKIFEF